MYLCYIDESGTSSIPGNTSHFILAGISVPIWHWKDCDRDLRSLKERYDLKDAEIHTAWMLRKYRAQHLVPNFDDLDYFQRRSEVNRLRKTELLQLQSSPKRKLHRQTKKNYKHTADYIHLTLTERREFISKVAECVSSWGFARLFAECIDKIHFDPTRTEQKVDEQAFEQVVSRFEQFLQAVQLRENEKIFGLLIHDNNPTVARRHTSMMKQFHRFGTFWTEINHIIETPFFVDSQLTGMVQIADLCSYAVRRYLENGENELFDKIFERADRRGATTVGVRHFTKEGCECSICSGHKK